MSLDPSWKREGFWYSKYEPELPKPVTHSTPMPGSARFLAQLDVVEAASTKLLYRGWSNCRCCGKMNGSQEHSFQGWRWPEGYRHYLELHGVRPSDEFKQFVRDTAARLQTGSQLDTEEGDEASSVLSDEDARSILKKHAAAWGDSKYEPARWVVSALQEAYLRGAGAAD